jgi:cytochrome c-type biogenesis protein CcmH
MIRAFVGLAFALLMAFAALAHAQAPVDPLDARLKRLENELRCLVCQNQTLADSNSALADDLRREVRTLAVAGKSDAEIKQYLVARYGDFVLYNPPVKGTTWLLWFGPFVLLVAGGAIWYAVVRRRRRGSGDGQPPASGPSDDVVAQARQTVYEEP